MRIEANPHFTEIPIPAQSLLTPKGRISAQGKNLARGIYSELKQTQRWPHLSMEDRREVIGQQLNKLTTWESQTPEQQQQLILRVDQSIIGRHQYEHRLAKVQKNMIDSPKEALELMVKLDISVESSSTVEQVLRHLDVTRLAMVDLQMSEEQISQAEKIKKRLAEKTVKLAKKIADTVKTGPQLPKGLSLGLGGVTLIAGLALVGAVGSNRFVKPISANEATPPAPIVQPKEESNVDNQTVNYRVNLPETNDLLSGDQPIGDSSIQTNETVPNSDTVKDGGSILQTGDDIPNHKENQLSPETVFGTKEWINTHIQDARQIVQKELTTNPDTTLKIPGVWEHPIDIHLRSYLKEITEAVNAGKTELPAPPYNEVNAWLLENMTTPELGSLVPGNNLSVLLSIHNLEHWDYADGRPQDSISLSVDNMKIGDRIVIGNLVYVLDKKIQINPNNEEENDTNKMLAKFVEENPEKQAPYVLIEACGNGEPGKSNLNKPRVIGRFSLKEILSLSD